MEEPISFARGVPAPECLPTEELADCVRSVLARDGGNVLSYGSPLGYLPLRELIAEWFKVEPDQVLLTNGSLQGFALLTQFYGRGRYVLVESPTYDRPLRILAEFQDRPIPVAMDEDGLIPQALADTLALTNDAAFIYTIPTFQNPSGRTLPNQRRLEIVGVAQANKVPILEDDPYGLIRFEGERPFTLFDVSRETTVYTSSFSKTIAPGLRVGWFIFPGTLAAGVAEVAKTNYIAPVQLGQAVAYEFISRGLFEPNLERVTALLKLRRDAMLAALEKNFEDVGAVWSRPEGGYFIWLEFPEGTHAKEVLDQAHGVSAVLGSDFGGRRNTLRLAYSYVSPEEIELGIERLAAAFAAARLSQV